jgi:hypothetical protein
LHFFIIINATPEKSQTGIIAVFLWDGSLNTLNYVLGERMQPIMQPE